MNINNLSVLFFVTLFLLITLAGSEAEAKRMNPCNPCAAKKKQIRKKHVTDFKKLISMGEKLWNNENMGKSGFSCMTCHENHEKLNLDRHHGMWPHNVPGMTNDIVTLTQMINFCMINPIEGKQIDPNSLKMTAMAAFYKHYAHGAMKNPCGMKHKHMNPCNPCAMKHKHMNPCNPCGGH